MIQTSSHVGYFRDRSRCERLCQRQEQHERPLPKRPGLEVVAARLSQEIRSNQIPVAARRRLSDFDVAP
jgi:hypothetical protein